MKQENWIPKFRPISQGSVDTQPSLRPNTSGQTQLLSLKGRLFKGNILAKPFSPPKYDEKVRPHTSGDVLGLFLQAKSPFYTLLKPMTPGNGRVSQSTQIGRGALQNLKAQINLNIIESEVYPKIYFAKIPLRRLLKELKFPNDIKSLPPDDSRLGLIFQIVKKLFYEISIMHFNILACQNEISRSFLIYFSDAEKVPFSKCCNSPVFVELIQGGSGRISCSKQSCLQPHLTEFSISFKESQPLWSKERLMNRPNSQKDQILLRQKISKLITTGFFKHKSITNEIQKLSKHQSAHQFSTNPFNSNHGSSVPQLVPASALSEFQDFQFQSGGATSREKTDRKAITSTTSYGLIKKVRRNRPQLRAATTATAASNNYLFNDEIKITEEEKSYVEDNGRLENTKQPNQKLQSQQQQQNKINSENDQIQREPKPNTSRVQIRLKSGFTKEKNDNKSSPMILQELNLEDNHKKDDIKMKELPYEDQGSLLDIKNMIDNIL